MINSGQASELQQAVILFKHQQEL